MPLDYGNYGIFLKMRNAGFRSSTVVQFKVYSSGSAVWPSSMAGILEQLRTVLAVFRTAWRRILRLRSGLRTRFRAINFEDEI